MQGKDIHIDVLFGQIQPEWVLQTIMGTQAPSYAIRCSKIERKAYIHYLKAFPKNQRRSDDEIALRARELADYLDKKPAGGIFALLSDYTQEVIRFEDRTPMCRQENFLNWRERTLALGQDLFTCAALAALDTTRSRLSHYFGWEACIHTDSGALKRMLSSGISENHFHLNGSTQSFPITWCYLMNEPGQIAAYARSPEFQENLKGTVGFGSIDNRISLQERLYIAAWIRAWLYRKHTARKEPTSSKSTAAFRSFYMRLQCGTALAELRQSVDALRLYSIMADSKYGDACLDYTLTAQLMKVNPEVNRVLVGERAFLYQCFLASYQGLFSDVDMDLFYLYLLCKDHFRAEMIQCNERYGFRNFVEYQDRKNLRWERNAKYWEESYRLSAVAGLSGDAGMNDETPRIQSLEMRIGHQKYAVAIYNTIRYIDDCIERGLDFKNRYLEDVLGAQKQRQESDSVEESAPYFYVLHFVKRPLEEVHPNWWEQRILSRPRNASERMRAKQQALALARALQSSYLCSRIRGIDACTHEIGCRPETFSTVFRFLRNYCVMPVNQNGALCGIDSEIRYWPRLKATYHVGEDFLELTDGLRAMDEAICFLGLERGDRLGHALALGIRPQQYYRVKDWCLYLPQQDLLDNLVWLLYRTREWGIEIPLKLVGSIQQQADQLFRNLYCHDERQVFEDGSKLDLGNYYNSWKRRGSDPELLSGPRSFVQTLHTHDIFDEYNYALKDPMLWNCTAGCIDKTFREKETLAVTHLLYRYHFGYFERREGEKVVPFHVPPNYAALMETVQDKIMQHIMEKGIAVECNPSSNKLIGTFDRYDEHPIFRFNHQGLRMPECASQQNQISVSVNTDDLGVFDTSLENEYALLYNCLQQRVDDKGQHIYSDDEILTYLEHLRIMGNAMTFPKSRRRR